MFAGINLGEYLTWSNHIKAVKNKASAAFYALAKVQNLLPIVILSYYIQLIV